MICGAISGWLITSGASEVYDAWQQHGPSYVTYGEAEQAAPVSEGQYKRHHYAMGGMMLGLGLLFWGAVALKVQGKDARGN